MKAGWQTKTLGEVLQRTDTADPLQSPAAEFDYIDVSSVSNSTFQIEQTQRLKWKNAPSRARRRVKTNDVIFATVRPTLQRIAIVPEHLNGQVCSTGYFVLRPKTGIDHRFVFYSLFTEDFMNGMENLQKGASYPAVTDGDIRAQSIPLPPLPEQRRIVGILDEAFEGIATARANAEKNLQNARALFDSHLQSVFAHRGDGWAEKRLERLSMIRTGRRDANHQVENGPYPFFTCAVGQFKSPTFSFNGPSIILPGNGANVGKVFYCDGEFEAYQRTYVVNGLGDAVSPRFLFYCFTAKWPGYIANKQFGSATNYIVVGDLKAFPVPTPALSVQEAAVERLDLFHAETQHLESLYRRKLDALDALKKSLLHQAFSGRL